MNILQQAARRLERLEALDKVAKPLAGPAGLRSVSSGSSHILRRAAGACPGVTVERTEPQTKRKPVGRTVPGPGAPGAGVVRRGWPCYSPVPGRNPGRWPGVSA